MNLLEHTRTSEPISADPDHGQPPLRVVHISATTGGVANAAKRLHLGLREIGVESRFLTSKESAAPEAHIGTVPQARGALRYADKASRLAASKLGFTGLTHVSSLFWRFDGVQVVHFHGAASNWFNLRALRNLNQSHALVWTMHDKNLATGACGYPEMWEDCQRWQTGCGNCPKARHAGWLIDSSAQTFRAKQRIFSEITMGIAAPNRWMYDFVAASPITRDQFLRRIPYGVDTHTFQPHPMAEARRALGLPPEGKLLLSVASRLDEPRKGLQYYPPLLRKLRELYPDVGLVLVGGQLPDAMQSELSAILPTYALGRMNDLTQLAMAYSAADLFVITSIMDNFPNVVLESLACGTPAVGFDVGGIPDMITPDETGALAPVGDTNTMAQEIARLLESPLWLAEARRNACRQYALKDFSLDVQARRYLDFYRHLMARTKTN
ncbi:MAG: glycosyltransferase [Anaerolineae bacterium]|nr:glycosyltransferase [Anaerolineae bacterium]